MTTQLHFAFRWLLHSMSAWMVAAIVCASASAQDQREHVMDTLVATGGVLPGVFTSTGHHILASQFGERLRLLRYSPEGVPIWAGDKLLPGTDWSKGNSMATDEDGAILQGTTVVANTSQDAFVLSAPWIRISGEGEVERAQRWEVELPAEAAMDLQPEVELIDAGDGHTFLVVRSADPLQPQLVIARFSGLGQPQWVGVLGPAGNEGPWGNASSRVAVDGSGGLLLVRHDAFQRGTHVLRVSALGQLNGAHFLEDPEGYELEVFDVKAGQDGGVVLIGRMLSADLPSGGTLIHLGEDGEVRAAMRYPWDIGRRLHPLQDGSFLSMDHPWSYRIAASGQVTYLRYLMDDIIDAELYEFVPATIGVRSDVLYMQGTLRRFLLQFGTQRLRPAFITHPVDAVEGCQWETSAGFPPVPLAEGTFRQGQSEQPVWTLLPGTGTLVELQVQEQAVPLRQVGAYCDAIVGTPETMAPATSGLYIAGPVQPGVPLWVGGVGLGEVLVMDALGRVLAITAVRAGQDRVPVALPPQAVGLLLVRWVAADGSGTGTLRVWSDRQ